MLYNYHYDICAIFISIFSIVFVTAKKGIKRQHNKVLFALVLISLIAASFDALSAYIISFPQNIPPILRDIVNYIYLVVQNSMAPVLAYYIILLTGLNYSDKNKKWIMPTIIAPAAIEILMLVTNPFTGLVFSFDAQGGYHHGIGMNILYAMALIYMLQGLYILLHYGKTVAIEKKNMVVFFMFATLGAIVFQMLFPDILIQLCIESLCLLGNLCVVDNDHEMRDFATGCLNRKAFLSDCKLLFENEDKFSVLVVKLPNMSYYNSTMGVQTVNSFMKKMGDWFNSQKVSIESYYVDSLSFAIICDSDENVEKLRVLTADRFSKDWVSDGLNLRVNVMIQKASVPEDIKNLDQLFVVIESRDIFGTMQRPEATESMYAYKRAVAVEEAIAKAFRRRSFEVYYQPVWDSMTNKIVSAEALLRLHDDTLGDIEPEEIIKIAEKNGKILEIGNIVLKKTCALFQKYKLEEIGIHHIGVNVSMVQCMNSGLFEDFEDIISWNKLDRNNIRLELNEADMYGNIEPARKMIKKFVEAGYKFTLDDYGISQGDFSILAELPFSGVKIGKTVLSHALKNAKANIILASNIQMLKKLDLDITALGIETPEDKSVLQNLKCQYFQGFYFSEAMPEDEFYRYCAGFNSR